MKATGTAQSIINARGVFRRKATARHAAAETPFEYTSATCLPIAFEMWTNDVPSFVGLWRWGYGQFGTYQTLTIAHKFHSQCISVVLIKPSSILIQASTYKLFLNTQGLLLSGVSPYANIRKPSDQTDTPNTRKCNTQLDQFFLKKIHEVVGRVNSL